MTAPLLIEPRTSPLADGLVVRRTLPNARQRSVGPFVFFDHFGPVDLPPSADSDVGPHPHIGLATVTYLLDGEMVHRDSLGTVQPISPGDINWMTAGRGIVHSERTPPALRGTTRRLHGLQLWVGLPQDREDEPPSFQHVGAAALPQWQQEGASVRVLIGSAYDLASPVVAASPTLYLDVRLAAGARLALPPAPELAVYSPTQRLVVNGNEVPAATMAVLPRGSEAIVAADEPARFVVIGGEPLAKPVHMWWNFVSTDPAKIEAAAARWSDQAFPRIPGESELVAMPPWRPRRDEP
jgi:redox-sensitive bicupin YhaK (pirin superfamily)